MCVCVCVCVCVCTVCVSVILHHFSLNVTRLVRKQLSFMLGRQQVFLDLEEEGVTDSEDLADIMSNNHLNSNFLNLGREVGVCVCVRM